MFLSIEGSTDYLSLAIMKNKFIVCNETLNIENNLPEIIIPSINNLLKKNSVSINCLSSVAVGCGPGSFTGLRVVIATAKGILNSNYSLQSIGVNGLAALAMSVLEEAISYNIKYIISMIDTKRNDNFIQLFKVNYMDDRSFPFYSLNEIEVLDLKNLNDYLIKNKLKGKNVLFVGHRSSEIKNDIVIRKISKSRFQKPDATWVAKLASYLTDSFENKNYEDFIFKKLDPIYARKAEINKKIPYV